MCVETSANEVVRVQTKDRFAAVDGRFPHWVSGYSGTRYSVVWYQTKGQGNPKTHALPKEADESEES